MNRSPSDDRYGLGQVNVTWDSERECPVCHKPFLMYSPDWGWKHGQKIVCSYRCMRVLEREQEAIDAKRGSPPAFSSPDRGMTA